MKCCIICNQFKDFSSFYKNSFTRDGHHSYCISCFKERNRLNRLKTHEERLKRSREYYYNNHETEKAKRREHYYKNKAKYLAASTLRDKRIKQACPPWLNKELKDKIAEFYTLARKMTDEQGVVYHVDHIIPIHNENVCGLHVPWNLQILTAKENLSKLNKFEIE